MTTSTVVTMRPMYEGANIRTWIGFKHFMYLVEGAVLQCFRHQGVGPQRLFHQYGLGVQIVDSSVQLPAVLELDDEVSAEVTQQAPGRFSIRLSVQRDGARVGVLRGRVTVVLVSVGEAPPVAPCGEVLALATPARSHPGGDDVRVGPDGAAATLAPAGSNAFLWSWRIPYFYCHYSDRMQHSGYVRALEEVVDRFLADRGLSVGRLLVERGWIPVVSRARVRLLADAHLEETVHTRLTVTDVFRDVTYEARMDCYVQRGDRLVHTATASIMHGYAISAGPLAGTMASLDRETVAALTGGGRS
jgi:acyl-CoA thioesterase FadM